jgi:general secretion pathway protein M
MRTRLRKAWEAVWASRAPRERKLITALLIVLSATLYFWLITAADRARHQLQANVPLLRTQAHEFEQQASEYERLNVPHAPSLPGDLRELLQTKVDDAGLSHALTGIDAIGEDQAVVVFRAVPFAEWLEWVMRMQSNNIRLSSSRVKALSEPGRVNATATFIRLRVE